MKALIIGFGSIGQRHFEILNRMDNFSLVDIVTKQSIKEKEATVFKELTDVKVLSIYDYFVIASETIKHYLQLKYICSFVRNKKILVEKPLFDKIYEDFSCNNLVFTAYNLRFHPIVEKVREVIRDEQVYYANVICGQYLPSWRPEQNYRQSYSADINQGGGVLRDLSHELDYLNWLFGDFDRIDSINTKISDLDINSDDIFTAIAVTKERSIINVTVDYISKVPLRRLVIHTKNKTIEADIINNSLVIHDRDLKETVIEVEKEDRNYSYKKMHESIINEKFNDLCDFENGKKIVNFIETIKYKEL